VKIFVTGPLKIAGFLKDMKALQMCNTHWEVIEEFKDFPNRPSMCNSLRFVIPDKYLSGFDYVYITDIDFLVFKQEKSHLSYFKRVMRRSRQNHAIMRSALRSPKRPGIDGWFNTFTRLVGGTVFVKNSFFKDTKKARDCYREILRKGKHDSYDKFTPASYREYDEVMLYRILRDSNLPIPSDKYKFISDEKFNKLYRDIHLGDFKFPKRRTKSKIRIRTKKANILAYRELDKDPVWQKIKEFCCKNKDIRLIFKYVDKVCLK